MTTETELSIEAMKIADMPEVLRIERACYDFPWSEDLILNCLKIGYHILVLREAQQIRAYIFASSAAGESHVLNLCVDPSHRGKGYAKVLLQQSIATVMVHGAKVMFLEVRESNHAAIALYESLNFVEIGRRDNYYRRKPGRDKPGRGRPTNNKKTKKSRGSGADSNGVQGKEDALVMSRDLTVITDVSNI